MPDYRVSYEGVMELLERLERDCPARTEHGKRGFVWACQQARIQVAELPKTEIKKARTNDAPAAHAGAERIEPTIGTARARVLHYLRMNGGWTSTASIITQVGPGTDRRARELVESGWLERKDEEGIAYFKVKA